VPDSWIASDPLASEPRGTTIVQVQSGGIAMSKAQKGNRESKKPKADKNPSANVSAYKAAQGQGKPAISPFAKKH
jgi:hypothetical protein